MEGGVEGHQASTPLHSPSRAFYIPGRPLVHGNSRVVEQVRLLFIVNPLKAHNFPRKVFSDPSESDEEAVEMCDTQGPSMRERMDIERQARMQAATGN